MYRKETDRKKLHQGISQIENSFLDSFVREDAFASLDIYFIRNKKKQEEKQGDPFIPCKVGVDLICVSSRMTSLHS